MKFTATAEHCSGGSVGHPCRTGVYSDPTDSWQDDVEGDTIDAAQDAAHNRLRSIVDECESCDCERKLSPGWDSWWNSVAISLWPQDAEAMAAWLAEGGDPSNDPYGIIPEKLKPHQEEDDDDAR